MRRLLADRRFRLLLTGQTLTRFGDVALFPGGRDLGERPSRT
jgi:hypothetical protein